MSKRDNDRTHYKPVLCSQPSCRRRRAAIASRLEPVRWDPLTSDHGQGGQPVRHPWRVPPLSVSGASHHELRAELQINSIKLNGI